MLAISIELDQYVCVQLLDSMAKALEVGCPDPFLLLFDEQVDFRMPRNRPAHDFRRAVRRVAVHDQKGASPAGSTRQILQQAVDGCSDGPRLIVCRYDDNNVLHPA